MLIKVMNTNTTGRPTIIGDQLDTRIKVGAKIRYKLVSDNTSYIATVKDIVLSYTEEYLDVYYVIGKLWVMNNEIEEVI